MTDRIKKKLKIIFANLCCSQCKNEFDENSIEIKRQEIGLLVTSLSCNKCGKSFGTAFIGLSNLNTKSEPLKVAEGPEKINYDDVINAHRFIKALDEHWQDYLPEKKNK